MPGALAFAGEPMPRPSASPPMSPSDPARAARLLALYRTMLEIRAFEDAAEAAIRAYRSAQPSCRKCGIRPEPDAIYCSNCGEYLPGKCASCGVAVTAAGVRYCIDCGTRLAA